MSGEELPQARIRRRRRLAYFAWIVPLVAAAVAGYLVYERYRVMGPVVTIAFRDGAGLRVGQTPVKFRGVQVGVELSPDLQRVLVRARLRVSAAAIAREGATFWIVRPELGVTNISGLGTVLTGPEIQALPGTGEPRMEFSGLDRAPIGLETEGLRVVLRAERPRSLRRGSPVFYRGVQVGLVQEIELARNATSADLRILIWERYAGLVHPGAAFWNVSGASIRANLMKGIEVDMDSLHALWAGGVEFATPGGKTRAKPGTVFFLHDAPRGEWLSWAPQIPIPPQK
jgi:paraquat-inducible protein B